MVLSVHKWLFYIFQNYEILIARYTLSLDLKDNVGMNSHLTTLTIILLTSYHFLFFQSFLCSTRLICR